MSKKITPVPGSRRLRRALRAVGMPPRLVGAVLWYKLNVGGEREMAFRRLHDDDTAALICNHLLDVLAERGYCPKLEGGSKDWTLTVAAAEPERRNGEKPELSVYANKTKLQVLVSAVNGAMGLQDDGEEHREADVDE